MAHFDEAWREHRHSRFTRPDGERYLRPDWRRYLRPDPKLYLTPKGYEQWLRDHEVEVSDRVDAGVLNAEREALLRLKTEVAALRARLRLQQVLADFKAGFKPDQPRVPAGNPDGGQWTADEGNASATDLSASRRRTTTGRFPGATPAQEARLAVAQARAEDAVRHVRELDPNWRPTPSLYESIEGAIRANEAIAQEAQLRAGELARAGIGPGPFASESLSARGPERDFTAEERLEINRIGSETGCHTCGTRDPGTTSGNFVPDHQPPNALNSLNRSQRLYPQCLSCSYSQGGWISGNRGMR